jgi:hypothetical protein
MEAIGLDVGNVVEDVNAGGAHAERDERHRARHQRVHAKQLMAGNDWHEYQRILRPLHRTHRAQQSEDPARRAAERLADRDLAHDAADETTRPADHGGARGLCPDVHVAPVVPDVLELSAAIPIGERGSLAAPRHVDRAVAGDDIFEDPQVVAHRARVQPIGARCQHEGGAVRLPSPQVIQD